MSFWKFEFTKQAAKQLRKLDKSAQNRIAHFMESKIAGPEDPTRYGKALKGEYEGYWRYRVDEYRIICRIEHGALLVVAVKVGHRKNVY